mgnify:CR=1 FL=1
MTLDIFNPSISKINKTIQGSRILVYGDHGLGKSWQMAKSSRPFFFLFEKSGLKGIDGIPYEVVTNWSQFLRLLNQFVRNEEKARSVYDTIVIDGVDVMTFFADKYLSNAYGVNRIKDGNDGFGLWAEKTEELFFAIDKLSSLDFTIIFIGNETTIETLNSAGEKIYKKDVNGDKRLIPWVKKVCEHVVYVKGNGTDENGNPIPSSAYLADTDEFFARSRYTGTPAYIEEFSFENLEKAIVEGLEKEAEREGIELVSHEEYVESIRKEELVYEDLMKEIQEVGTRLVELGQADELTRISEKHLGINERVSECVKGQEEVMSVILDEMIALLNEVEQE